MKNPMKGLLLGALSVTAGSAGAADYYLAAKAFIKLMPDSSTVPMWGYVEDPGGTCYNGGASGGTALADRLVCISNLPDPQVPGPRLDIAHDDADLNIYLSNGLPQPTSLVIASQEMPVSGSPGPTWNDGTIGPRTLAIPAKRVRSLGAEAAAGGGAQSYSWTTAGDNPLQHGTYVVHSGTHPQQQVYMGLYASVIKDFGVSEAYPGVAYDDEIVLYYSEIDTILNESIACVSSPPCSPGIDPYSTSIHYQPEWFLVNGEPYMDGVTPDIFAGSPGEDTTLLRLLNASGHTHVPVLQGMYMSILAEDGHQYNYQDGTGAHAAPHRQYSAMLPPLKTKDAILDQLPPGAESRFAVYDGNGYMTNPTDPTDFGVGDDVGGMLVFLAALDDADNDGVPDTADNCVNTPNPDQADGDGDGVGDACDNCTILSNANQRDTDADGYGNRCDTDLNNSGATNNVDLGQLRSVFGSAAPDVVPYVLTDHADFNGDGGVNNVDLGILRTFFGQGPGPSCCGLPLP